MSLPKFTAADIARSFDPVFRNRAKGYLDAVTALEVDEEGQCITAQVKGTARTPYRVDLNLHYDKKKNYCQIDSYCSCPVGDNCKHGAAVAEVFLQQQLIGEQSSLLQRLASFFEPQELEQMESKLGLSGKTGFSSALSKPLSPLERWVSQLDQFVAQGGQKKNRVAQQSVYYLLQAIPGDENPNLLMFKGRVYLDAKGGMIVNIKPWDSFERALSQPPGFVEGSDLYVFTLLEQIIREAGYDVAPILVWRHEKSVRLLQALLDTGRCYFAGGEFVAEHFAQPLQVDQARACELTWQVEPDGSLLSQLVTQPPAALVIPCNPPWYIDPASRCAGPVIHPQMGPEVLRHFCQLPPVGAAEQPVIAKAMQRLLPDIPKPSLAVVQEAPVIDVAPRPVLRIGMAMTDRIASHRGYMGYRSTSGLQVEYELALLSFAYGSFNVQPGGESAYLQDASGNLVYLKRDSKKEQKWIRAAAKYGFLPLNLAVLGPSPEFPFTGRYFMGLESRNAWATLFSDGSLDKMRKQGWELNIPDDFRHRVLTVDDWEVALEAEDNGWLGVDMGILVNGQRLPLAPLLLALFRRDARWLDKAGLQAIPDQEAIRLQSEQGWQIAIPAGRLKPIAETLVDLFDGSMGGDLRVPPQDAWRLMDLADQQRWQFHGNEAIVALAKTLRQAGSVQAVAAPAGLQIDLRHYQQEGLAWLQYLRSNDLAGILADDMGLGKTAQTLAHLLLEKEAGRLQQPALVVMPTSLIFNWKQEAARFAPDLRVLSLHGKDRATRFEQMADHDVCLTTYPLLWRDRDALKAQPYHLLILDEAQSVKNVSSQAAQVVRELDAQHRLCLTGTPLENHLGELWAQFDFLLPGFLGDSKGFAKLWRTPIEKQGNQLRRDILAKRLRPFILRRHKEDVAAELPEKTIIVRSVALEAGQRDLYETVRSAMDVRVREEIASKGFARSQIVILDALLKLRQVCCDPRLLKTEAAKKVKERAKLDLLMDMLPEMVAEGRRILLFSQFTSMLALIGEGLQKHKLPYVELTGDTQDRETPVKTFQNGEVPIFLISLKAGGVGLNLTAADTVIHYDPWWNPAVENQATDRAHRLGQTKKVFVYKLVVAGSIEEKILALQEKKAELAASILSEDHEGSVKFSDDDLAALFAPLPE